MRILVVDDEKSIRLALADELSDAGYEVRSAESGERALELLVGERFDLVISDVVMDRVDGFEILDHLAAAGGETKLILMTAYGTVDAAVRAVKAGALDYICKPFEMDHLLRYIGTLKETIDLRRENRELKSLLHAPRSFPDIIGTSPPMQHLFGLLETLSDTPASILLEGETGTGKDLVAEAIHQRSSRRAFVPVSCAALSRELLESELFGHEQGAFTGAHRRRRGRFELADGGTLFLDEVDDIPLETQTKLLRVLQSGRFERVGGEESVQVDVRLIAATKANLLDLVEQGKFRRDLYYRLNVIHIVLPPLRDRREDIPLLVSHFLRKYAPERNLEISPDIMELLLQYDWDGNVRELQHAVERLVLLQRDGKIDKNALPGRVLRCEGGSRQFQWGSASLPDYLDEIEKSILESALHRASGGKTAAAELLNIPLPTLKSKLAKFGIR